jgi:hypothetical protein
MGQNTAPTRLPSGGFMKQYLEDFFKALVFFGLGLGGVYYETD